jgi:hypothetical protein
LFAAVPAWSETGRIADLKIRVKIGEVCEREPVMRTLSDIGSTDVLAR